MKRLLVVILAAALGWSAYWFVGSSGAKSGFTAWFDARQSEGWQAEVSDITVSGYPNRFDTTFTEIALADPDTGVAWQAPFFQLFALSYKPNHVIGIWPNEQTLAFPDQSVQVTSEKMRASLVLRAGTALLLDRANFSVDTLGVQSSADWRLAANSLNLALHRQDKGFHTYRLALKSEGLAPPIAYNLPSGKSLPKTLKIVQADLFVGFDAPWDRHALEDARPQPTWIDVKTAQVTWGDLELQAAGKVTVDSTGYPNGELTLRATNWREIIAVARATDQIPTGVLNAVEQGLELLAGLSGNPKTLDIPLNFGSGATRIGPIPIGPAPRLVLR